MNVIVSNKQKEILDNANIDAIKDLNGLFNVDDLINNFKNYFFTKMILDATSVVEFANPDVLRKLVRGIGAEKLIILLPENPEPPRKFLEMLVELGIYNFSTNVNEIINYIQNPNTYDDVKKVLNVNENSVNQLSNNNVVDSAVNSSVVFNDNNMINNNQINNNQLDNNSLFNNNLTSNFNVENIHDDNSNSNINNNPSIANNLVNDVADKNDINRFNSNNYSSLSNFNVFENNYNSQSSNTNINNSNIQNNSVYTNYGNNTYINKNNKYVLGVKNVTSDAGSTSLIYMLKQTLEYKFRKRVLAIELNGNDFSYFRDNNMISIPVNKLEESINNNNYDVILIDLNNTNYESICTEVIYLVEPSILKLNKLMAVNKKSFLNLNGKKVVLNKCLLSNADIDIFSREAGFSFFFVIPPLNDRVGNSILETLITKLNINNSGEKRGFLGLFNRNS